MLNRGKQWHFCLCGFLWSSFRTSQDSGWGWVLFCFVLLLFVCLFGFFVGVFPQKKKESKSENKIFQDNSVSGDNGILFFIEATAPKFLCTG